MELRRRARVRAGTRLVSVGPVQRQPVAVLGSGLVAGLAVELVGLGALVAAWGLTHGWWFHPALLAVAVASGLGLGAAHGAAEVVGRGRGVTWGLLVGLTLSPLPALCGGYALLRMTHPGQFEAIDALWRVLADAAVWRPGVVIASLALALHAPLLVARCAERPLVAQADGMALGAVTWLAAAVVLQGAWPVDLRLDAWVYLLLLALRLGLTPVGLALGDRVVGWLLRQVRGVEDEAPIPGPEASRWRVVLVGTGLAGLGALCLCCAGEPADLTTLRLRAAVGPAGGVALVRALADPPASTTARFDAVLGVAGALQTHAPRRKDDAGAARREAIALLRPLVADGCLEAIDLAIAEPEFKRHDLLAAAERSTDADAVARQRVLGKLLVIARRADEGIEHLARAAEADDVPALLALADRSEPVVALELLRRARRLRPDDGVRRRTALALERIYDLRPELRSSLDPVEEVHIVDTAGRPLDGVVRIEAFGPELDGWGSWRWAALRREVRGGRLVGGLTPGFPRFIASFSFDEERLRAGIVDGHGRMGAPGVSRVTLKKPTQYGTVDGVVLDPRGRPVVGADVKLRMGRRELGPRSTAEPGLVTFTDADGRFVFRDVPLDTCQVGLVDDEGCFVRSATKLAAPGGEVTLNAPLAMHALLPGR